MLFINTVKTLCERYTCKSTLWFHMLISFCSQFQKMYVVFNQADVQLLTNDRSSLKQVRALLGSCDFSKGHNTVLYSPNGWHLLRRLYQWKKHRTASSWKNQCEAAMMCSKKKQAKYWPQRGLNRQPRVFMDVALPLSCFICGHATPL